jgi:hypothetical protein
MEKKPKAIFTLQHNEYFYLPIWCKWYRETFAPEDMYILAHNPSIEMVKMCERARDDGFNVKYLFTDVIFDHDWLNSIVHGKQRELLEKYNYVMYTDCDELIAPDNMSLGEFIDKATEEAYRCDGWELHEKNMYSSIGFCKTLLTRIPLIYTHGYHQSQPLFPINEHLKLYHIHKINYDEAWKRNQVISQEKWDAVALANGLGTHNHIGDEQDFKNWFNRDVPQNMDGVIPVPQEILDRILN